MTSLDRIAVRLRGRAQRKAYRRMVERWNADGGDYRMRLDYSLGPDSLVLDVGGYEGQWASDLYSRYRCRILVFEPVERYAAEIDRRFAANDDIEVLRFGLGARTRDETIHVCGASSSLHKKKRDSETVRIVDVAEFIDERGIGSVQLMKVNIEGGELELLDRLIETGLIGSIDDLQVQFHYFVPDADRRMAEIQRALKRTHAPTYQYRYVWENWRRNGTDG